MVYLRNVYKNKLFVLCLFSLIGIGIYLNIFNNEFLYDDELYVVFNQNIRSLENIKDFFTNPRTSVSDPYQAGHYRPLVVTSYALNYALGGLNPAGYHITNLIFHIGTASLIFLVIREFNMPIAAIIAGLIFLIHPFNSEAVNYVTARSSVMSGFFYMLAFYFWIKLRRQKKVYLYVASLLSFVAGMLSKEVTVTFPLIILIYEVYNNVSLKYGNYGKLDKKYSGLLYPYLLCLPFFLIVIIPYLIIRAVHFGSIIPNLNRNITTQLFTELPVLVKHLWMFFIPYPLAPVHYVEIQTTFWTFNVMICALILLLLIILAIVLFFSKKHYWNYFSFFIIWFFIVLLPTTLFPLNAIFQENRGYLAIVGFAACVGIILEELLSKRYHQMYKGVFVAALMILILVSGLMVFNQNKVWKNEVTLWSHVIKNAPESFIGYSALGVFYRKLGELDKAKELFHRAIVRGGDGFFAVHYNLGKIYIVQKDPEKAITELEKAISIYPYSSDTHNDLGAIYYRQGKTGLSEKHYIEAARLDPSDYMPCFNLGILYDEKGKINEAIAAYKKALSINPMHIKSHFLLGMLLEDSGYTKDAGNHYKQVVQIGKGQNSDDEKEIIIASINRLKKIRE